MKPLPDYRDALAQALLAVETAQRADVQVDLAHAPGRVLSENVCADRDLPPFNRAQMDGYAVRRVDLRSGLPLPAAGMIAAGTRHEGTVPPGSCVRIATGAPVPSGLDTVVQHERTDRGDLNGRAVQFAEPFPDAGHAIHRRAADASVGDVLIPAGTLLASHHLGIAASVGRTRLKVVERPIAAVLTSGDEVRPADTSLEDLDEQHIRNSNGTMLAALLMRFGADVRTIQHVADTQNETTLALGTLVQSHNLVVTVGGVSAGERDFLPAAFETCGINFTLSGASIQPGKPIVVGRSQSGTVVIGLPGNPVSVLACACLFAWPVVRSLSGCRAGLPWQTIQLAEPVRPNAHRRAFRPAILQPDGRVRVPRWAGSGDLAHTGSTHGLLELPVSDSELPAGTILRYLPWP